MGTDGQTYVLQAVPSLFSMSFSMAFAFNEEPIIDQGQKAVSEDVSHRGVT